jgi:hypothetical protein
LIIDSISGSVSSWENYPNINETVSIIEGGTTHASTNIQISNTGDVGGGAGFILITDYGTDFSIKHIWVKPDGTIRLWFRANAYFEPLDYSYRTELQNNDTYNSSEESIKPVTLSVFGINVNAWMKSPYFPPDEFGDGESGITVNSFDYTFDLNITTWW